MSKSRFHSPKITLTIAEKARQAAIKSNSGGCLIAAAILQQYPHLSDPTVDMATVRFTDRQRGIRYTYLTPPEAQHVLLSFDRGWENPYREVTLRRAVHLQPLRDPGRLNPAERPARLAYLEAREADGSITSNERGSLTIMRKNDARRADRPERIETEVHTPSKELPIVRSGQAPVQGKAHPNLLRGRNRHFGAKLADPGEVFRNAVEAAVAERLAAGHG